jgi:hypothetical protein
MVVWVAVHYYGGKWIAEQADGKLTDVGEDAANALIEAGIPYVDAVEAGLAEIGEDIGEAISELGGITLAVIKGSGIALVEGMSDTYDYVARQVSPYRVEAVAVVWSMLIYGLTISTVLKRIKNA